MLPHRLGMSCCAPQQNWRQSDQSVGLAKEDRIGHDQEAINPTLRKSREGGVDFVSVPGSQDTDSNGDQLRRLPHVFDIVSETRIVWISQQCDRSERGNHLPQKLQPLNQIGRKAWQSVELPICPSRFDRNGLALNITGFFETLPKRGQELRVRISRSRADQANDRQRRLLRPRRERPRSCCAAKGTEKFAPLHVPTPGFVTAGL
jgi:hypothetical protein